MQLVRQFATNLHCCLNFNFLRKKSTYITTKLLEVENKKDTELNKSNEKKIITEFVKESENQNSKEIEKKECEKAMMIEKCKESLRKVEIKKANIKKENTIESQEKVELQKNQFKRDKVINFGEQKATHHKE